MYRDRRCAVRDRIVDLEVRKLELRSARARPAERSRPLLIGRTDHRR